SVLMATVFAAGFGAMRSLLKFAVVLFIANSAGYFLGAAIWAYAGGETGMLLWGVVYGLFLGAGLGAVIHLAQSS
ncbi:MAG TPA: hypothetical protein VFY60_01415, partial [Pyrinomonadaceae bacterium]|nr:hypothetical protein [Pyrinomonadaceae bacterium]